MRFIKVQNLFYLLLFIPFIAFANTTDGVQILSDNPTEGQLQIVRDGASRLCSQDEELAREQCLVDYYAEYNLEEEDGCD